MRLLLVDPPAPFAEEDDFRIVEVMDSTNLSYAILSHRWGDEEITYQELRQVEDAPESRAARRIRAKQGYVKIRKAAQRALAEGYDYLWADTCCIDKTSSAELSEAINSMYRWYEESAVCYAYLVDVPAVPMRSSNWFERGWTLQELIAPRRVKFFNSKWAFIGQKSPANPVDGDDAVLTAVVNATGIDVEVLSGRRHCHTVSVAKRMSWASRRVTTRLEDVAYCLLGIFNVNMPLLYGEGSKAFIRLQEAILREREDHSIFAWWSDSDKDNSQSNIHGLLAPSPRYFFMSGEIEVPTAIGRHDIAAPNMTSKGLQVSLYLHVPRDIKLGRHEYIAFLSCYVGRSMPCIRLRNLWGDQYARYDTFCETPEFAPATGLEAIGRSDGWRTIYVRQDPQYLLPPVKLDAFESSRYWRLDLETAVPQAHWDEKTRTVQSLSSDLRNPVAVFLVKVDPGDHFASRRFRGSQPSFLIVSGYKTNILGQFEPWCAVQEYGWPASPDEVLRAGGAFVGRDAGSCQAHSLSKLGLPQLVIASVTQDRHPATCTLLTVKFSPLLDPQLWYAASPDWKSIWSLAFQPCALPAVVKSSDRTDHAIRVFTPGIHGCQNQYRQILFGDVSDEDMSSPTYFSAKQIPRSNQDLIVQFLMAHLNCDTKAVSKFWSAVDSFPSLKGLDTANFPSIHWKALVGKSTPTVVSLPEESSLEYDMETNRGVSPLHVAARSLL